MYVSIFCNIFALFKLYNNTNYFYSKVELLGTTTCEKIDHKWLFALQLANIFTTMKGYILSNWCGFIFNYVLCKPFLITLNALF